MIDSHPSRDSGTAIPARRQALPAPRQVFGLPAPRRSSADRAVQYLGVLLCAGSLCLGGLLLARWPTSTPISLPRRLWMRAQAEAPPPRALALPAHAAVVAVVMGADPEIPAGNPLRAPNTVMTQGYGVGTHAPAHTWGAVDLAIDGDGDGHADPRATWGAPVYATHRGIARLARDTWPAGNHIWIEGARFKTGYAHLAAFLVHDGQIVEPGQLIGLIGSTGMSSGPHLDYQVWKDGVNVNPLDYGALDLELR